MVWKKPPFASAQDPFGPLLEPAVLEPAVVDGALPTAPPKVKRLRRPQVGLRSTLLALAVVAGVGVLIVYGVLTLQMAALQMVAS